ncbi:GNAT family N-acetyltransferase [Streptomyces olivochromogenes]|uniref:GNAT family N-acetyltransferase n=1 Tax=Streptomyces olivochromogenes TaxID=1963 RepID=UPI001F3786BA|nr:GNAT family N-acetyltransferase [Streptomyces olivochromogenes]MCF3132856.1 GNAT family N-acetyltransferase [Streptomyces olivochromogenes]
MESREPTGHHEIRIREGGAGDIPVILGLLDGALAWLVAQGRTRQWGTTPWSANPRAVGLVHRFVGEGTPYIAEIDGVPAGTLTLSAGPGPDVAPVDEPERYVHLFASDHRFRGRGVGSALLAHAAEVTGRLGISLLRLDCYAGDDGRLVAYYEDNGFARAEPFTSGEDEWPGRVMTRRVPR